MKKQYVNYFRRVPVKPDGFVRPTQAVPHAIFLDRELIPTVYMTEQAHGKMMALIQECPIEIGWRSPCERDGLKFFINDVFVPNQECTIVSTRMTKNGEANLFNDLKKTKVGKDAIRNLLCWGHSHVDMDVFASGIDEGQTRKLLIKHQKNGYYVRLIGNKHGEMFASVYLLNEGMEVHHPTLILPKIKNPGRWAKWAKQEIAEKVDQKAIAFENMEELEFSLSAVSQKMLGAWLKLGLISRELYDDILSKKNTEKEVYDGRKTSRS